MGGDRTAASILALITGLLAFPALAQEATSPVDGIAAVVNDEVITIGEVRRAARWLSAQGTTMPAVGCGGLGASTLAPGDAAEVDPPAQATGAPAIDDAFLARTLQCLIDGALAFREARRFPRLDIARGTVLAAYEAIVSGWPSAEAFARVLRRNELSVEELQRDIRRQLLVQAYVDSRFRTTVDVSDDEARTYYEQELVPDMRGRGIEPPSFEEVAERFVAPILREQEVNRRVESWIRDLRARAEISVRYPQEPDS